MIPLGSATSARDTLCSHWNLSRLVMNFFCSYFPCPRFPSLHSLFSFFFSLLTHGEAAFRLSCFTAVILRWFVDRWTTSRVNIIRAFLFNCLSRTSAPPAIPVTGFFVEYLRKLLASLFYPFGETISRRCNRRSLTFSSTDSAIRFPTEERRINQFRVTTSSFPFIAHDRRGI